MKKIFYLWMMGFLWVSIAHAQTATAQDNAAPDSPEALRAAFDNAQRLDASGKHFDAATAYFNIYTAESTLRHSALTHLTESLIHLRLYNAAVYFFLKTLQTGDSSAIQRVLAYLPELMEHVGGDVLRPYILQYTQEAEYDAAVKNHFYYFLGKDALLKGDPGKALQYLSHITAGSGILAQSLYLKGSAYAMTGSVDAAVQSFNQCRKVADRVTAASASAQKEFDDLKARCIAGAARSYYQAGKYTEAEETYDDIPKSSFVWTDILFEQAWAAFAKGDYNRSLGKLVTYRSPDLQFVFNPEADVLRAQSFYALCYYDDVNKTINEFNASYAGVGQHLKEFLLENDRNLGGFFNAGKAAYNSKLHTKNAFNRALNRFVRGPYFAGLVRSERDTAREMYKVRSVTSGSRAKFGEFLQNVLNWRLKSIRLLGGLFVKNSTEDMYHDLLSNLDKMSFIKLEMLKGAKNVLERNKVMSEDEDGVMKVGAADIDRKDYQYFWTFNGEFWVDELGDYVFALESQCKR